MPAAVTVSEQHLMQVLLQQADLLQMLGQYMVVPRGDAADQAVQAIREALPDMQSASIPAEADLQLTDGLLSALRSALQITRCLGKLHNR